MDPNCCRRILSKSGSSMLETCGCGALHLTIGPLTVRLDSAAAFELSTVLNRGMAAHGPKPASHAAGDRH